MREDPRCPGLEEALLPTAHDELLPTCAVSLEESDSQVLWRVWDRKTMGPKSVVRSGRHWLFVPRSFSSGEKEEAGMPMTPSQSRFRTSTVSEALTSTHPAAIRTPSRDPILGPVLTGHIEVDSPHLGHSETRQGHLTGQCGTIVPGPGGEGEH